MTSRRRARSSTTADRSPPLGGHEPDALHPAARGHRCRVRPAAGRPDRDLPRGLDGAFARFGRSYTGEPGLIAEGLGRNVAVQAADTLLLTVPNQLGVEYNARMLETIAREIAPAIGWQPSADTIGV